MAHLIKRFNVTPLTLYRMQSSSNTPLREMVRQLIQNRSSYDFKLAPDGLIYPVKSDFFEGPNGMSLRPKGKTLIELMKSFKGNCVYEIPEGTEIPKELVLILEHSDHYSLQTSIPVTEEVLNERLHNFLSKQKMMTRLECLKIFENDSKF